jgi:hypothetical protein
MADTASGPYKEALDELKKVVQKIRENQCEGETVTFSAKEHPQIKITIDLTDTKVASGAFIKCGNGSAAVSENGTIEVTGPGLHGKKVQITQLTSGDISSLQLDLGAAVMVNPVKPEPEKHHKHHPKEGDDDTTADDDDTTADDDDGHIGKQPGAAGEGATGVTAANANHDMKPGIADTSVDIGGGGTPTATRGIGPGTISPGSGH